MHINKVVVTASRVGHLKQALMSNKSQLVGGGVYIPASFVYVGISYTTMKTNILHQRFCNFSDARTAREGSGVSEKRPAIQRALYMTNVIITRISERIDL